MQQEEGRMTRSTPMLICARCGAESPDGFRFCGGCGAALLTAEPPRQARKVVTALFCDVTGSTALGEELDPEVLQGVLNRYFEEIRGIIERHGGTVEKFIGDAVMAVFGIPRVHEDDALRAVRAAADIRERLPAVAEEVGVALRFRTGVNTGTVLMGEGENLAIGDAVNVAARLEQAAEPGEIVLGEETLSLVRDAVEVEALEPLELKGKSERVPGYRLVSMSGGLERRFATPMVGRDRELRRLRDTFAQAVHDRSCQLFTVLGSAGVGKSRLAAELLARLDARVVQGHCLSYGEGITYWPVVEILKQFEALPVGDAARPLRSLLGESGEPVSAEEIAWGFRKLLEQEAQERPLLCVFDDLHWGEETLLDLVEHVADLSRDAPILLLCMARPLLLERRPSWGGGKWNATTVLLEPLDGAEAERLLSELGGVAEELRGRVVQAAEGNPLFLEEMLALVGEAGGEAVEVPPTIKALLAARLDQLDPAERAVLESGSVEGRTFHRGAVAALADGGGAVDQRLVSLVRKELVRPDRPQFPEEDAYRFRHLLIRDAAYDGLPKAVRADLHGRFAAWLEQHGSELVELDEILGYHIEQAARYLHELGRDNSETALAAGERLAGSRTTRVLARRPQGRGIADRTSARAHPAAQARRAPRAPPRAGGGTDRHGVGGGRDSGGSGWVGRGRRRRDRRRAGAYGRRGDAIARWSVLAGRARAARAGGAAAASSRGGRRRPLPCLARGWPHRRVALPERGLGQGSGAGAAARPARRPSGHRLAGASVGAYVGAAAGRRGACEARRARPRATSHRPDAPSGATCDARPVEQAWAVALPAEARARELGFDSGGGLLAEIAALAGDNAAAAAYLRSGCDRHSKQGQHRGAVRATRPGSRASSATSGATTRRTARLARKRARQPRARADAGVLAPGPGARAVRARTARRGRAACARGGRLCVAERLPAPAG